LAVYTNRSQLLVVLNYGLIWRLSWIQRSMQSIIWFLARWSRTYLMSSDGIGEKILDSGHHHEHSSKKTLLCFFGEHNQGKLVLDIIVRIAFVTLTSYTGEKDLQVWVYHFNNFNNYVTNLMLYSDGQNCNLYMHIYHNSQ